MTRRPGARGAATGRCRRCTGDGLRLPRTMAGSSPLARRGATSTYRPGWRPVGPSHPCAVLNHPRVDLALRGVRRSCCRRGREPCVTGGLRTPICRFWRPALAQLSYVHMLLRWCCLVDVRRLQVLAHGPWREQEKPPRDDSRDGSVMHGQMMSGQITMPPGATGDCDPAARRPSASTSPRLRPMSRKTARRHGRRPCSRAECLTS